MEEIKIRIIKQKPRPRRAFLRAKFSLHRNSFFTILGSVVFAGLFCTFIYVFATPPASPYAPGEELNPTCAPLSANCTVTAPAIYSFGSNNFSGTGSFTTTNTIQGGTLKVGSAYTFPTADGNNGQVLSTNGAGVVSWSDTGAPSMIYPGAGIPLSTGSAWGTSITNNSSNWNSAYSHKTTEDAINGLVFVNGAGTYSAKSIGTDVQAYYGNLNSIGALANGAGWLHNNGTGTFAYSTPTTSDVGLGSVENTALSTWTGSSNLYTVKLDGSTLTTSSSGLKVTDNTYTPLAHKTTEDAINGLVSVNGAGTYSAKSIGTDVQAQLSGTGFVKASGTSISYDNSTYMANPMDAAGQLIYGGASGAASKLAAGLSGQILQSGGAATPAWSTATYPATTTANQILYSTGNNTVGAGSGLTYDGTNLTVGGSSEVFTVLTNGNVGIGDTNPSFPLEIVSTSTPQFMIYYTNSSVSTSLGVNSAGNLTITPSGGNVIVGGTLTVGATNTAGTLATRVITSGPPAEADANGSLVIDSGDGGRLYFRYNNAWNYVAQNSGFQIPNFETADPISGEQIKEGDIVLGMINKTLDDKALHGVYVKWDSIKAQLLAEARGELASSGTLGSGDITGVSTETFLDKVANVLVTLGITIKDGVTNINKLAVQNLTADVARIKKVEMVDSATGEIYCTWVENGDWVKSKGECGSVNSVVIETTPSPEQQIQAPQPAQPEVSPEEITQQAVKAAQQAVEQAADQAAREAAQKVQEQLQNQSPAPQEQAPSEQTPAPAEQTPAPAEQTPAPAEQTPAPAEQTAPAGDNTVIEIAPSALTEAVGSVIRQVVVNIFSAVWGFIKGITGFAGKKIILSSVFQNSTASLSSAINSESEFIKWILTGSSEKIKNSTAGLTSFVAQNINSNFSQVALQIKIAKEMAISSINILLNK